MLKKKIIIGCDESGVFTVTRRALILAALVISFSFASFAAVTDGKPCSATNKKGEPCGNMAQKGQVVCYVHNPANQCAGKTKAGERCRAAKGKGSAYCSRHQTQGK